MNPCMNEHLEQLPIPLMKWYSEHARQLPWRESRDPYKVWLSEIMLQQTRVAAVIGYYNRILERCPTVADLAALDEDVLMKFWQGLGYYNRARLLHKTAKIITEEYHGQFPSDYSRIRALPGIGDYTAGAICSISFDIPVPAVDGNVLRVVARITGDDTDITTAAMKKTVTAELQAVMPVKTPGNFNQALMELGATVCLPSGAPLCEQCPAADFCQARLTGRIDALPVKAPPKARTIEEREVFLIFYEDKVALRRRPPRGLLAGLWEFPCELAPARCPVLGWERRQVQAKHIFTHVEWHMTGRVIFAQDDTLPDGWIWADRQELAGIYAIPHAYDGFTHVVNESLSFSGGM